MSNIVELLLVEDDPRDLELTLRAFRTHRLGNHIEVARDGQEALDYIFCTGPHAGRDCSSNPKVVLLDLKLLKVSGIEVLRRMKGDERTRAIPVVVLTSSKEDQDLVQCYALGVNSYIVKPVDFDRFSEAIREIGVYWLLMNALPSE